MTQSDASVAAAHARLVVALVRQLADRHGGAAAPQVVQTPISTLILAGDRAYKLKRPVRLPFLDFSTVARRRHFCEEELRLNRRTAPALYLDVQPVTGRLDAPVIGAAGEAVDWLLRMRRFAAEGEFHVMAQAGRLRARHIDALVAHLAAFHLALPPLETDGPLRPGARDRAAASLDEVAADPARPPDCSPGDVAALRHALERRFAVLAPLMARRAAGGFVRECHGDLHLGNIVQWRGQVMAFDAIEFDPALRRIDIVDDLAFCFMDLLAHGLPTLAWRLANGWSERLGDFEGLAQLSTYAACRALVRAKVALLGGDADRFRRYWALAVELARPPVVPRLVLVTGLSGSGKSTVAQALATHLGAIRVRSDVERKRLHHLAPTAKAEPGSELQRQLYGREATRRTYARLGELARALLGAGMSVVVDAACLRQDERETLRQIAGRLGAQFAVVVCMAPPAVLKSRIVCRARSGDDPSDATLDVLALQQRVQEPVPADWAAWTHTVVNDAGRARLARRLWALAKELARPGAAPSGA